jgi:hypothetical protein
MLNLSGSLLLMPTLRTTSHHLVTVMYCSQQGDVKYWKIKSVDGSLPHRGYCCSS